MGKRFWKHFAVIICIVLVSLMAAYIGLAIYYHNAFEYGTWINGVYCTGRSIEDVNRELAADFTYEGVTVRDKDGNNGTITAQEIGYEYDFAKALEIFQKQQNSMLWIESIFRSKVIQLAPAVSYDEAALDKALENISFLQEQTVIPEEERKIAIIETDHGYELLNERTGVLDVEEAKQAVRDAVAQSEEEVELQDAGCYHDLALSEEMEDTLALWEKIREFQDCRIVYQMGDDLVPVDAAVVSQWIRLDEDGQFALDAQGEPELDEEAVGAFIKELAQEYDTVGCARQFQATSGRTVTVQGGIYGNQLDQEAETAYLIDAFTRRKQEVREPEYKQRAQRTGKEDIGDTYVEVDMGEQMMYYYQAGKKVLETPVVTGNTSLRRGTPEGVNYVYLKQTNRILRGPGYASHVDFWMPVNGGIGIHDSAWRSKYGGTIYKTNGSHGCINTPRDVMVQMYELVEVGTPVVMFY